MGPEKENPPPEHGAPSLGRVELLNLLLAGLVAGIFLLLSETDRALGVAVGALITGSSLRLARVALERIVRPERTSRWPVALFWFKYMALIALLGLVVLKFKLDVAGLLTGVTILLPAIVLEAAARAAKREE